MCYWPKCENDLNLEKKKKRLRLIFSNENYSKFNISFTLGLKITKSPPRNPTHQGLSNNSKSLPHFS